MYVYSIRTSSRIMEILSLLLHLFHIGVYVRAYESVN